MKNLLQHLINTTIFIFIFIIFFDYTFGILVTRKKGSIESDIDVSMLYTPKPYVMYGGRAHAKISKGENLNSLGYRGHAPEEIKNHNEQRIFILGGSTVFLGNPSISQILEDKFVSSGNSNTKVYNWGVLASVTRMDLARLAIELIEYSPDLVIFYGLGNDIIMPFQADPRPSYPPNYRIYEINPLMTTFDAGLEFPILSTILNRSNILRYFWGAQIQDKLLRPEELLLKENFKTEEWRENILKNYLSDIKKAFQIARSANSDFLAVTQPLVYFKHFLSINESLYKNNQDLFFHANNLREQITSGLKDLNSNYGVKYLDLTRIFEDSQEEIFLDGIHIKQDYYEIIVNEIYKEINSRERPH